MMRHHVVFRFRLPPVLMLRAPLGAWRRAPRAVTLDVGADAVVNVVGHDRLETFARKQVLSTTMAFLRAVDRNVPPMVLEATLSAPSCRERPEYYGISLGAAVSIARTDPHRAPVLVAGHQNFELVNLDAG